MTCFLPLPFNRERDTLKGCPFCVERLTSHGKRGIMMAEFKESEHPRDKDGMFTDKGNVQGWTKEKKDRVLNALRQFKRNSRQSP